MRLAYILALVTTLAACDFRSGGGASNRADGGPGVDAQGPSGADGGSRGSDASAGDSDAAVQVTCASDPAPTGPDMPCPPPCDSCAGGVCTVDCGRNNCNDTIDCPADYECVVLCDGGDACDGSAVTCPPDLACSVVCSGGSDACGDFDLMCGAGSCSIECEDDTCDGAVVHCGEGACSGNCDGASPASVECGDACDCTEC